MTDSDGARDPRIYMAAERTFLAWIRTGLAFMAFGFVVARFGVFLREVVVVGGANPGSDGRGLGISLWLGLGLIGTGVMTCVISALRHTQYIAAIDQGRFRHVFGSSLAFVIVGLLAILGVGMAVFLIRL
ncbi:MAG: DUF202 domain-containing protein [Acidobacteria bacterium]|nr:DUF202 domain-containing protein [Acidobacteriota bacterium]